jgi:ribosome-associated protein
VPAEPQAGAIESKEVAVAAARTASAKQASRVVILDVRELIVITDYFVIASGSSDRQVKTILEEVEKALKVLGVRPVRTEGEPESGWVLLDYVDAVVHVFAEEEREYYDLERLWRDAPRVPWEDPDAASSG